MATAEIALGLQGHSSLIPISSDRHVYPGHTKQGTHRDFLVQAFAGNTPKKYNEPLSNIAIYLSQQVFQIPFDQARDEVRHNTKGRITTERSIILANTLGPEEKGREKLLAMSGRLASSIFRTVSVGRFNLRSRGVEPEPNYIGYSTQQSWLLNTDEGIVRVMYVSTMAVLPEHRRMGLAAKFLGVANSIHQPDVIMLRTRSGAAVAALYKSELIQGSVVPLSMTYDKDPLMGAVLELVGERTMHLNPIDPVTGVTREVYPDKKDSAYEPDPKHPVASKADAKMKGLGLDRNNGDAMYVAIRVIGRERWSQTALTTA